ncbi:PriCT-2 domain-containing protein [Mycobacterium haemophilum DSM 44634]|nr:PriCT-2 domain-containing protein [Mycobacterium haemophilum DSM 44634]
MRTATRQIPPFASLSWRSWLSMGFCLHWAGRCCYLFISALFRFPSAG